MNLQDALDGMDRLDNSEEFNEEDGILNIVATVDGEYFFVLSFDRGDTSFFQYDDLSELDDLTEREG